MFFLNVCLCFCMYLSLCVQFCPQVKDSVLSHFQVGVVGDNEDWLMVHQVSNEPEARSLEVPGLNPYTHYR